MKGELKIFENGKTINIQLDFDDFDPDFKNIITKVLADNGFEDLGFWFAEPINKDAP